MVDTVNWHPRATCTLLKFTQLVQHSDQVVATGPQEAEPSKNQLK